MHEQWPHLTSLCLAPTFPSPLLAAQSRPTTCPRCQLLPRGSCWPARKAGGTRAEASPEGPAPACAPSLPGLALLKNASQVPRCHNGLCYFAEPKRAGCHASCRKEALCFGCGFCLLCPKMARERFVWRIQHLCEVLRGHTAGPRACKPQRRALAMDACQIAGGLLLPHTIIACPRSLPSSCVVGCRFAGGLSDTRCCAGEDPEGPLRRPH